MNKLDQAIAFSSKVLQMEQEGMSGFFYDPVQGVVSIRLSQELFTKMAMNKNIACEDVLDWQYPYRMSFFYNGCEFYRLMDRVEYQEFMYKLTNNPQERMAN